MKTIKNFPLLLMAIFSFSACFDGDLITEPTPIEEEMEEETEEEEETDEWVCEPTMIGVLNVKIDGVDWGENCLLGSIDYGNNGEEALSFAGYQYHGEEFLVGEIFKYVQIQIGVLENMETYNSISYNSNSAYQNAWYHRPSEDAELIFEITSQHFTGSFSEELVNPDTNDSIYIEGDFTIELEQ